MLPIRSKIHNAIYARPIGVWVFLNFISGCVCGGDKFEPFNFKAFFIFMGWSTLIIGLTGLVYIFTRRSMTIEKDRIILRYLFSKKTSVFLLTDISDFSWANKPIVRSSRYGPTVRLKNEFITVSFKGGDELTVRFDDYQNFDVIKKFLFDYCVQHKVISVRPLEERKRSHA